MREEDSRFLTILISVFAVGLGSCYLLNSNASDNSTNTKIKRYLYKDWLGKEKYCHYCSPQALFNQLKEDPQNQKCIAQNRYHLDEWEKDNSQYPYCEKGKIRACPPLQNLQNGKWICQGYNSTEVPVYVSCQASCSQNAELNYPSSEWLYCRETRQWDKEQPTCVPRVCQPLSLEENLVKTCSWNELPLNSSQSILIGTVCKFHCNHGYELHGNDTAVCNDESWDCPVPVCTQRAEDPLLQTIITVLACVVIIIIPIAILIWLKKKQKWCFQNSSASSTDLETPMVIITDNNNRSKTKGECKPFLNKLEAVDSNDNTEVDSDDNTEVDHDDYTEGICETVFNGSKTAKNTEEAYELKITDGFHHCPEPTENSYDEGTITVAGPVVVIDDLLAGSSNEKVHDKQLNATERVKTTKQVDEYPRTLEAAEGSYDSVGELSFGPIWKSWNEGNSTPSQKTDSLVEETVKVDGLADSSKGLQAGSGDEKVHDKQHNATERVESTKQVDEYHGSRKATGDSYDSVGELSSGPIWKSWNEGESKPSQKNDSIVEETLKMDGLADSTKDLQGGKQMKLDVRVEPHLIYKLWNGILSFYLQAGELVYVAMKCENYAIHESSLKKTDGRKSRAKKHDGCHWLQVFDKIEIDDTGEYCVEAVIGNERLILTETIFLDVKKERTPGDGQDCDIPDAAAAAAGAGAAAAAADDDDDDCNDSHDQKKTYFQQNDDSDPNSEIIDVEESFCNIHGEDGDRVVENLYEVTAEKGNLATPEQPPVSDICVESVNTEPEPVQTYGPEHCIRISDHMDSDLSAMEMYREICYILDAEQDDELNFFGLGRAVGNMSISKLKAVKFHYRGSLHDGPTKFVIEQELKPKGRTVGHIVEFVGKKGRENVISVFRKYHPECLYCERYY